MSGDRAMDTEAKAPLNVSYASRVVTAKRIIRTTFSVMDETKAGGRLTLLNPMLMRWNKLSSWARHLAIDKPQEQLTLEKTSHLSP
jgi:hypothetical protein